MVHTSITHIESRVGKFEAQGKLSHGYSVMIQSLVGELEMLDTELQVYHYSVRDIRTKH